MIDKIKFDSRPYILESTIQLSDDDLNGIYLNIIKDLLESDTKIFNLIDRKFNIIPTNYNNVINIHSSGAKYSFLFFKTTNKIPFVKYSELTESEKRNILGVDFGYILLVNIGNYIFISRKNTGNINPENFSNVSRLSEEKIKNYMAQYDTVKKATLKSLENKQKGILKRDFEGIDIKEDLEQMNISDNFLDNIVLGNTNEPGSKTSYKKKSGLFTFSSTLLTGDQLDHIIVYYNLLIEKFSNQRTGITLDDKIAQSFLIEETKPDNVIFYSLMFHVSEIKNIESVSDEELEECLKYIDGYYKLEDNSYHDTNITLNIIYEDDNVVLEITFPSYLDGDIVNKIKTKVNKEKLFTINTINSDNFIYTNGAFYKYPVTDIDFDKVKGVFIAQESFNNTKSEKGKIADYQDEISTDWSTNSIFYSVENYYKNLSSDNLVICGDLGVEIADHIIFNKESMEITLVHSKGGSKKSYGASQFQELVGQATKNIEGFNLNNDVLFNKIIALLGSDITCSIGDGKKVCKNRIVSNHSSQDALDIIEEFKGHPNITKKLVLAINFFDKNGLKEMAEVEDYIFTQFKNILARLNGVCGEKSIKFSIFIPKTITV